MDEVAHAPLKGVLLALLLGFSAQAADLAQDVSASSPEKDAEPSAKTLQPGPASSPKTPLESDISAVLSAIEGDMPSTLRDLSAKDRAHVISSMLSALGEGIEVLDGPPAELPAASTRHPMPEQGCLPGVLISGNRIFYLRLNRLDKDSVAGLKEELDAAFRLAKRPLGLVIDLRDCDGIDTEAALAALPALEVKDSDGMPIGLHLAVLVGGRSSGSSELLAGLVEHERKGLVIGAPTSGHPFKVKTVKAGGFSLSLADRPESLAYVHQTPLKPSIDVPAYPQVDFTKLRSVLRSEDSDLCLSRAVDLLVGLDSIKRKWKKTGN